MGDYAIPITRELRNLSGLYVLKSPISILPLAKVIIPFERSE